MNWFKRPLLAFSHLMILFIFDTQLINWFVDTLSNMIGINLWFALQISEHCPCRRPCRLVENLTWFSWPGVVSVFAPCVLRIILDIFLPRLHPVVIESWLIHFIFTVPCIITLY